MNKYLFLGQLQSLLEKQLDEEEVRRVMDYYDNYMIEAIEYGKKESEVLAELGDPEHLAATILENLKREADVEVKEQDHEDEAAKTEETERNNSLSAAFDDLMKSTTQTINEAGKAADLAAGKIAEYFTDLFTNETFFEDSEQLAGNMSVMGEIKDGMELSVDTYDTVRIMLANITIKAYFSEEEKMRIVIPHEKDAQFLLEVSHDEHTLAIREKKARIYNVFSSGRRYVEIYLPINYKGKMKFECSNSNIQLKGKSKKYPGPISVDCDNGSVQIKDTILGMLDVKCDNGRIDLKRVIAYKAVLNCCNGLIRYDMLENDYAKNIAVQAQNGLIKINNERWSLSRVHHQIPARNDSKYELSVNARCDNGMIRLTGF